jgi:hypothetical protein
MALAIDPEKHGMPTIDEWADSVFGPMHVDVGPGDPQLGLPDFTYNDGVDLDDGVGALAPAYGLDALEDAGGAGRLLLPSDGVAGGDGVDWADWPVVMPPAMLGMDVMHDVSNDAGLDLLRWEDVSALLNVEDAYVDVDFRLDGDRGADAAMMTSWAPAYGADLYERAGETAAIAMAPAHGLDVLATRAEEDADGFYAPLSLDGPGDGVDVADAGLFGGS